MKFTFELNFNPIPYQNNLKYTLQGHAYKTEKLKHYQNYIGLVAKSEMVKNNWKMLEGDFKMDIVFWCKDKKRGDATNMLKAIEDALEGVAYIDDWNRTDGFQQIRYCKFSPHVEIEITPIQ